MPTPDSWIEEAAQDLARERGEALDVWLAQRDQSLQQCDHGISYDRYCAQCSL